MSIRTLFPKILFLWAISIFTSTVVYSQLDISAPEDYTVECSEFTGAPVVTATSPCGGVIISYTQDLIPGFCPGNFTMAYTFTIEDACSNFEIVVVVVSVVDTTDPIFTYVPEDITISCEDEIPLIFPEADDNCDGEVLISWVESITEGACTGTYTIERVFTAEDDCGNSASIIHVINVVDITAPTLVFDPEIVVSEPGIYAIPVDNCSSATVEIIANETYDTPLGLQSTVTYRVADDCGNYIYSEQIWNGCGLVGFHALNYEGLSLAGFGYRITDNTGAIIEERISTGGSTFDEFQCVPKGCYRLTIINPNPLDPNIEWHLDGGYDGTFYGFISLEYDFSVGGPCNNSGCTIPSSCNYNPFTEEGTVGLCFASCSMMTFISEGPLGNDIFGAQLTSIFTNYYQSFVLPSSQILELTPFTEYTLAMSTSGNNGWNGSILMFSNPEWGWMYQATLGPNGPFEVSFTTGGPGCMDQNACNFNPQATIDDQSCAFPQTYYMDNDNDGYALVSVQSCFQPTAGFVLTPMPLGDCNDYNPTIHPNAIEICGNNIDEDCDLLVDENCAPSAVPNDNFQNAPLAPNSGSAYPQGNCYTGTLVGASEIGPGNPANVLPGGGQDAWYSFVATSSAVRVVCSSSAMDVVLELHDSNGLEIDMENATTNPALGEIMVSSGLITGQTYFVAVRSYDGVVGSFSLCIQIISFSGCADGSGTYDLCTNFKPTYSGASSYTFSVTPTGVTPGNPTAGTAPSQIPLSTPSLALRHGGTYAVTITGNFSFVNAAGNSESLSITGNTSCAITIAPHANLRTKSTQRCPATVLKGTTLQAKPFICGALYHTITFTEVGDCAGTLMGGIPFSTTTSGSSSSKSLASIGGVQTGKWYMVQWTPHFAYGAGMPGTLDIIHVAGGNSESMAATSSEFFEISIYPNPGNGESINLHIEDVKENRIEIRVLEGSGRIVLDEWLTVDGSLTQLITFNQPLSNGIYFIETRCNGKSSFQKMIVSN
ncbi:MAG: MopE-related protein [Flavobacteriales bacterium]